MRKSFLGACLLPLLLVTAAACTKSDDGRDVASVGGTAAPSPTPSLSMLEQGIRYAQCMRAQGVAWPDPEVDGDSVRILGADKNVDADVLNKAEEACKPYQPTLSGPERERKVAGGLEFSRCMRENGVEDFPDPDASGPGDADDSVRKDPQFEQAEVTCRGRMRPSSGPSS
ncbi:hypothetical protein ACFP2T_43450 [Plantactinospora solaniradicis]|uniref:Uncharacterized protein n=1 Tax=Plantactinospora solaniradicis TaxID=1723736 RepID=A0ABW1KN01_9ACTN